MPVEAGKQADNRKTESCRGKEKGIAVLHRNPRIVGRFTRSSQRVFVRPVRDSPQVLKFG